MGKDRHFPAYPKKPQGGESLQVKDMYQHQGKRREGTKCRLNPFPMPVNINSVLPEQEAVMVLKQAREKRP